MFKYTRAKVLVYLCKTQIIRTNSVLAFVDAK
jgi:hypothetical protein